MVSVIAVSETWLRTEKEADLELLNIPGYKSTDETEVKGKAVGF